MLDADELLRVHGRHAPARSSYAHPHAALRRVLAAFHLGGRPQDIRFGRHPCAGCGDRTHGRPRVVAPATGLEFSLTCTGPHWAVAITAGEVVGLDMEAGRSLDVPTLSALILSERERALMASATTAMDGRQLLLRAWTRKEAVLEAVGLGIAEDIRMVETEPATPSPVHVAHAGSTRLTAQRHVPGPECWPRRRSRGVRGQAVWRGWPLSRSSSFAQHMMGMPRALRARRASRT